MERKCTTSPTPFSLQGEGEPEFFLLIPLSFARSYGVHKSQKNPLIPPCKGGKPEILFPPLFAKGENQKSCSLPFARGGLGRGFDNRSSFARRGSRGEVFRGFHVTSILRKGNVKYSLFLKLICGEGITLVDITCI